MRRVISRWRGILPLRHLNPMPARELKAESNELVNARSRPVAFPRAERSRQRCRAELSRASPTPTSGRRRRGRCGWAEAAPCRLVRRWIDRSSEHVRLQEALRNAGYLSADAAADGVYGGVTRKAIVAFAQAEGLPDDGFLATDCRQARSSTILQCQCHFGHGSRSARTHRSRGAALRGLPRRPRCRRNETGPFAFRRSARSTISASGVQTLLSGPVPDELRPNWPDSSINPITPRRATCEGCRSDPAALLPDRAARPRCGGESDVRLRIRTAFSWTAIQAIS